MRRAILLLACVAGLAAAQDRGMEVFAPFVSRLKAQAGEATVLLTWRNPSDVQGAKLVYRGTKEIAAETLSAALMVSRLDSEAERFEDRPPDDSPYFYAVLVEAEDGRPFEVLIPFRNKTSEAVQISALAPEQDLATEIAGLQAAVAGDAVRLSFRTSRSDRELLLFRGTYPMSSDESLLAADSPVALDAGTREYEDYPIPGVDTYYAVVDVGLFKVGKVRLVPGENATRTPVQVPISVQRVALPPASATRPLPLPFLRLSGQGSPPTDLLVPARPRPLRADTRRALEGLLPAAPAGEPAPRAVEILGEDRTPEGNAESRAMREILRLQLLAGQYRQAEAALRGLLSIRRSEQAEARIHFYLGQSLYLQGLYQDAALEFLLARGQMYVQTQPWLEHSLRLMRDQDRP